MRGRLTPGGRRIGLNGYPFTLVIGTRTPPRIRTFMVAVYWARETYSHTSLVVK